MKLIVKAEAQKSISPDYMKFDVQCAGFDAENKEKSVAVLLSNIRKAQDCIYELFGEIVDIETRSFHIDPQYDYERRKTIDKNGDEIYSNEQVFEGYKAIQSMEFETDLDVEKAMYLTMRLNDSDNIYVSVSYTLKDEDSFKNSVLLEALKVAKSKASIIAESMDADSCKCTLIDYVNTNSQFDSSYRLGENTVFAQIDSFNADYAYHTMAHDLAQMTKPKSITLTESVVANFELI